MAKQHLIALDLDGTLLKDNKTISIRSKRIISRAIEDGHIVVIATGRPYRSSSLYYQELGLTTPIVNFNGAYVHHPLNRNWGTFHESLNLKTVHDIIEASVSFQVENMIAEVIDDLYLHQHDKKLLEIFNFGNPTIQTGDLRNILKHDPTALLLHPKVENVETIRNHLLSVHANVIDHRKWGAPLQIIEIVKRGLNKAVGLKRIADYYLIPKERIIAFGDEDNDLEMIEFAGYGIAMGNAISDLKQVANDITKTNEQDGVAYYLETLLQLKR